MPPDAIGGEIHTDVSRFLIWHNFQPALRRNCTSDLKPLGAVPRNPAPLQVALAYRMRQCAEAFKSCGLV